MLSPLSPEPAYTGTLLPMRRCPQFVRRSSGSFIALKYIVYGRLLVTFPFSDSENTIWTRTGVVDIGSAFDRCSSEVFCSVWVLGSVFALSCADELPANGRRHHRSPEPDSPTEPYRSACSSTCGSIRLISSCAIASGAAAVRSLAGAAGGCTERARAT